MRGAPARRRRPAGLSTASRLVLALAATALATTTAASAADLPPNSIVVTPASLCTTPHESADSPPAWAVLAAYAPFPDPGYDQAKALLPLISVRPHVLDMWVRRAELYCAITPHARQGGPRGGGAAPPRPPALVVPATSLPHINSHRKTQMAAFHWCRLDEDTLAALHGEGGSVRLVDAAEAAVLRGVGFDGGHAATAAAAPPGDPAPGRELACEGGVPFPPALGEAPPMPKAAPLEESQPPPALAAALAAEDGADDGVLLGGPGPAAPRAGPARARPAPPPPAPRSPYETLAACVGPLYGSSAAGLVAWFEHHLDAGVGAVYAYVVDKRWAPHANPVHAVLGHYAARGVATIVDWSSVGAASSPWAQNAWYFNQPALHNDCLNRVRGKHRHAIFMDTDEFVEAAGWAGVPDAAMAAVGAGQPRRPDAGALTRAIASWVALPAYASTHSVRFPCRWRSMLGDGPTRAQLGGEGGPLPRGPGANATVLAAAAAPALASHPPLAATPCTEPLLDRLPYRAAKADRDRSKFIARPDRVLAVEAHYVLHSKGREAVFADGTAWHNHYFILKDGIASHPTAARPARPGANASVPGQGLQVPVPAMYEVEDAGWPARFVASGLRARVAEVAAVACAGL